MKITQPTREMGQAHGATPRMLFSLVILTGLAAVGLHGAKHHSLPEGWPAEAAGGPSPDAFQVQSVATPGAFTTGTVPIPEPLRAGRIHAPDTLWVARFSPSPSEDPSDSGWLPLAFGGGRGETQYRPSARDGLVDRLRHRLAGRRFGGEAPGQSLVYVWAASLPPETMIPNAYTDKAMMVVVRSGEAEAGRWWNEERNILDDFRRAFGEPPPDITSVAIMTDADDTGAEATACYGDIFFLPPGS